MLFLMFCAKVSEGGFFGTVMLTEMNKAINNQNNFLFLICREMQNNEWFFQLFSVATFIKCCTLTTPIFHYRLSFNQNQLSIPNFGKKSIMASESLIKAMWQDFDKWKIK